MRFPVVFAIASIVNTLYGLERIAVMQFEAGKKISVAETESVTERVRIALIKGGKFDVVSNDQIGFIDSCKAEACLAEVGRALKCTHMMVGRLDNAFGQYTLSGKILDVAQQKYIKADEIVIQDKGSIRESARLLVENLTGTFRSDAVATPQTAPKERSWRPKSYGTMVGLTVLAPGAGHLYAEQWRGGVYIGAWVISGMGLLFGQVYYSHYGEAYKNAVAGFDDFYERAQTWKKVRGYSSYVFLATYVIALIDIFITGTDYEKIYVGRQDAIEVGTVQYAFINTGFTRSPGNMQPMNEEATGLSIIRFF
jgi:hypothetical protein